MIDIDNSTNRFSLKLSAMVPDNDNFKQLLDIYTKQLSVIKQLKDKINLQATTIDKLNYDLFINRSYNDIGVVKRFVEIINIDTTRPKITINPCTGRITVKLSNNLSQDIIDKYLQLAEKIKGCVEFLPLTYRGKIEYNMEKDDIYYITYR
jgi:hypothetical protein